MAVAGAPTPLPDHADAAVEMAIDVLNDAGKMRWPSGDPIVVRGGVATGRAVAGVIGFRRYAYDLWGDTVNLASRLEENADPGRVLISEATAGELTGRYEFGSPQTIDLKGKGPVTVRVLVGPNAETPVAVPLASEIE